MQQYIFGFGANGFFITFSFRLIWNIHLNVYFIASSYLVASVYFEKMAFTYNFTVLFWTFLKRSLLPYFMLYNSLFLKTVDSIFWFMEWYKETSKVP